jgi:hypothetical protein
MPNMVLEGRFKAIALAGCLALSAWPLAAQFPAGSAGGQAPRGMVVADCYARAEIWQGDVRTPVRLLFTRVMYNETAAGGLMFDLGSQWNKFILPMLAGGGQTGHTNVVYCQYADSPANTELSRWTSAASRPEEVNWPGRSIRWQPVVAAATPGPAPPSLVAPPAPPAPSSMAAPAWPTATPAYALPAPPPAPQAYAAPVQPQFPSPQPAPQPFAAPPQFPYTAPSAPQAGVTSYPAPMAAFPVLGPAPASPAVPPSAFPAPQAAIQAAPLAEIAEERDEQAQQQGANAVYGAIMRRNQEHALGEQARQDEYLRQLQAYQQQLEATRRANEEQQRQYAEQKAAYDAAISAQKDR